MLRSTPGLINTLNASSALVNQRACLGVSWNASVRSMRLASAGAQASDNDAHVGVLR
jgi:hypothetical protein